MRHESSFFPLRLLFPVFALCWIVTTHAQTDTPERGGFLFFKDKSEQISSELFPVSGDTENPPPEPALLEATRADEVVEVSDRRRDGLFRFGRGRKASEGDPVLAPLPPAQPIAPAEANSTSSTSSPASTTAAPPAGDGSLPVFDLSESEQRGEREQRRRFGLPFRGSRDRDSDAADLRALANDPQYASPDASGDPAPSTSTVSESATQAETSTPAPAIPPAANRKANDKREGGLFSKIPKPGLPSMPKRQTDYLSVENVIQDGEFVGEDPDVPTTMQPDASSAASPATAEGPVEVDVVKIYSSWEQVKDGGSTAERILKGLR